jgi:RNA-dependent RNA polymerase
MKVGCSISSQTLINLAENGVPIDVFTNMGALVGSLYIFLLFKTLANIVSNNLDEIVKWFTDLDGPDSMLALRDRIAREGGIVFARRAREIVGEARARGFRSFEYEKKTDDEIADIEGLAHLDTEIEDKEQSSAWWRDPISGLPSRSVTCLAFFMLGF